MKITLPILALAGSALASLETRQASVVIGIVNTIAEALKGLDAAVQAYSGGSADAVMAASKKIGTLTSEGIETVKGSQPVSLTDAVSIQGAVQGLQTNLENAMASLISKKQQFVSSGQGGTIAADLASQLDGAKALQAAITSRVPPETQSLATQLSAGVNQALQKAIEAYADQAGASAGGSSGGASAGGASAGGASAGGASAGSSSSGASSGSAAGGSGSSGSKTSPGTKTSAGAKPAMYTGAATVNKAPVLGALALGAAILAL